jgi:hypothetical protein
MVRIVKAERSRYTYPIALKRTETGRLKVVKPRWVVVDGWNPEYKTYHYYDEDVDVLLYLDQLAGRTVLVPRCLLGREVYRQIKQFVTRLWVEEGADEHQVEQALESLVV